MKKITLLTVVTILVLLQSACGGAQETQEKSTELNLYAWSEYVPEGLLEGFTEQTGIKVNYDTYSSNEELMAKLQAGASGYDVIIPSDYTVAILANQGLLEELDLSQLPNFANIADEFKNRDYDPENKYSVPYQWGTTGLAYDTDKITTPVTKWADLWNPEFAGRVVLLDDEREVIGMALSVLGFDKNSTDEAELEQAKEKLLELKPSILLFDSDSPSRALLTGDAWIGQLWNGEGAIAHDENPAIDYICPEEGCTIWIDTLAVPKGAPHKDSALAFLNYVMDPEASVQVTEFFGYSNPNTAAIELMKNENPDLYEWYMGFSATNPPAEYLENGEWIVDVGDATSIWDRIWTEFKGGE